MVLQNYQIFIELTSNMIYIIALGVGFKCPRKIHLNTQCPCIRDLREVYMALACNFTSVGKHKFMHAHIAKYTQLSSKQKHIIIVIGVRWSGVFCHRLVYAGDMIT